MLDDIRIFRELGKIRGFVVGALTKHGRVDVETMKLSVVYSSSLHPLLIPTLLITKFRLINEILPLESTQFLFHINCHFVLTHLSLFP